MRTKQFLIAFIGVIASGFAFAAANPTLTIVNHFPKALHFRVQNKSLVKVLPNFSNTFTLQPGESRTTPVDSSSYMRIAGGSSAYISFATANKQKDAYLGVALRDVGQQHGRTKYGVKVSGYIDNGIAYYYPTQQNGDATVYICSPTASNEACI